MLRKLFVEFCNESSIHGLRYLTDERKSILERLLWIIFVIFSILSCFWFTYNTYLRAQESSIVMTISNRPVVITDITFSLTICSTIPFNVTTISINSILNGNFDSDFFDEDEIYTLLSQYCNIPNFRKENETEKQFDYVQTLIKANLRLNYMQGCRFGVKHESCREDFQEVITNMGLCYTYNSLSSQELYRSHNGTTFDFSTNLIQIANSTSKLKNILGPHERGRIDLNFRIESKTFKESCKPESDGFQVALRSPQDVVVLNNADARIKEDYATHISLTPSVLRSDENLKSFRVEERECYFENERSLYFMTYYTQENCHFECLTNHTLKSCGCVFYYMPRLKTTRVCFGEQLTKCANDIEQGYDNLGIGPCHCYALCNYVAFQVNVATHKLDLNNFLNEAKGKFVETRIGIFTKDKSVFPLRRSQLYGFNEWVASFGGVLGLFLGISILSIIEFFYYLTMRPLCFWLTSKRTSPANGKAIRFVRKVKPVGIRRKKNGTRQIRINAHNNQFK